MNTAYTETSILDCHIAHRTTLNIWLVGGIKLTGIARFHDSRVLVVEPLDTPPDGAGLIVYKQACASIGRVCSQEWARRGVTKRKSRALTERSQEDFE
jgi:hypothetical protein